MNKQNLAEYLSANAYPGRGVFIGKSTDGKNAAIVYFIMGRSINSRNRVFVAENGGIKTQAKDPAKLSDPSLIIYSPVRIIDNCQIVTNGDQTDTIYNCLKAGGSFEEALRTREFEPDAPNFTPRISGLLTFQNGSFSYRLSILKSANGNGKSCQRFFFDYAVPVNGEGHLIHTYRCDGNPIPSFEGEPVPFAVENDFERFTEEIWNGLNEDNKVSLFTRFIDLKTGSEQTRIINKY